MDGINVRGAADLAEAELLLARQTAMTRNLPGKVRFYKTDDGTGEAWRMMRLGHPLRLQRPGRTTSGSPRERRLPGGVIFEHANNYSSVDHRQRCGRPMSEQDRALDPPGKPRRQPKALQDKSYVGFFSTPMDRPIFREDSRGT